MKKTLVFSGILIALFLVVEFGIRIHEKHAYMDAYHPQGGIIDLQALNYNDGVIPKAKPREEFRILSFGDSFCHATVSSPYSYNGILQQKLLETGRTARVVNLGEPISSIPQYLATMNNWLPQIEHDMILVNIFAVNDLGELIRNDVPEEGPLNQAMGDLFVDSQTGRKRMDHIPRRFPSRLLDYAQAYVQYFSDGSFVSHAATFPYTLVHGPVAPEAFARILEHDLETCDTRSRQAQAAALAHVTRLARFLSQRRAEGKRVLIVLSPAQVQVDPALFQDAVARLGTDPGRYDLDQPMALVREAIRAVDPELAILDLTPLVRAALARGVNPYYPLDAHWDMTGNRIVGEALADWIAERW